MAGFAEKISHQVRKDTSHHLIYPPGVPLKLGDIVERSAGIWVPVGNIADDLGIPINAIEEDAPGDWEATSSRGYDFEFKLAGQPSDIFRYVVDAEAGVKITLKGENAFVLSLAGTRFDRLASIDAFWEEVKQRRGFWTWDLSRRIVTRIVKANSGTFLASGVAETSFELSAEAGIDVAAVSIADLAAGFTLRSTMAAKDKFVSAAAITPLFGAHRVKLIGGLGVAEVAERVESTALKEEEAEEIEEEDL